MKHSLTRKITCIILCLVAATVLLCWVLNITLLESYYIRTKQEGLESTMATVRQKMDKGTMYSEQSGLELVRLCTRRNITMMIMDSESRTMFFIGNDEESCREQFWEILFAAEDDSTEVLDTADSHQIGKYMDSRLGTKYLILWGTLQDGSMILMRTPLESIRESVTISNRFLAYVGIVGVIISGVICYFVTRRITNPILQLAELSRRMTNLEFDAKFQSRGKDEIDYLGEHMNVLSETLEQTISELKSANNELLIDIEKKDRMDEMRKEFLSNVSHELKTPLALIQGYAEGLQDCINDDAQSREFYCEVIIDEAGKMNRMVKQLLTLNQLEFGNDAVVMERFDLTEMIQGVIDATSILRQQHGIALSFSQEKPIYVWADEFKVEEVLTNFMSNAIHHADGEKRIVISLAEGAERVRVSVFNTGMQIPKEELTQIWEKFYKVDKARTREYGGSGIGLSIVKAIMDSFHQQCGVRNLEDGVEFWFELDNRAAADFAPVLSMENANNRCSENRCE